MRYDCLIIDDEKLLADSTAEYFNLFGVSTAVAYSAGDCRRFFETDTAKLLLLDINLKDGSGFALCRELRENTEIPILFLSARSSDDDKIVALHIGGDDYVQKPCSLAVLLAKVKAVLKRYGSGRQAAVEWAGENTGSAGGGLQRDRNGREVSEGTVECTEARGYADGRLRVDFPSRQVWVEGKSVKMTSLEFRLLAYLIRNRNRVATKQELFENVWEDKFTGDGTLNVHIRRIREAIERNPGKPEYILTVWGDGYRFHGGDI